MRGLMVFRKVVTAAESATEGVGENGPGGIIFLGTAMRVSEDLEGGLMTVAIERWLEEADEWE
jgi:hypothetical protein